LTSPQLAVFIS